MKAVSGLAHCLEGRLPLLGVNAYRLHLAGEKRTIGNRHEIERFRQHIISYRRCMGILLGGHYFHICCFIVFTHIFRAFGNLRDIPIYMRANRPFSSCCPHISFYRAVSGGILL